MPEGFAFPVSFRYWTPLRADPSGFERREGPAIHVFGRLAPGATLDDARAELTAIGQRTAAALPGTHARLRPHVLPYTYPFGDLDDPVMVWIFRLVQLLVSLLLVVVAVNVSILVYARTAMRQGEIAVRSALGASRRRIVAQLFLEALVLAAAAAAVGLTITRLAFAQLEALATEGLDARLPFWIDFELSYATVAYVAGLAVLAAVIVGVAPAMKATGRRMRSSLSQLGGGTGIQLGRTWTVLIVAQVAVAVAVLPMAGAAVWNEFFRSAITGPAFPAEELLTARLGMSSDQGESEREPARFAALHSELVRRLEAEPGVSAVTFASRLPDAWFTGSIEVQGIRPGADVARHEVRFLQVDPGFLDVYEATLLAGRSFQPADQSGPATAVIANRSFVKYVLGGGQALGRRFRYTRAEDRLEPGGVETGGWYEIVGVVDDSPANESSSERSGATLYHPAAPGSLSPVSLVVRVQGIAPESLAGRLKEIATALDPSLRLEDVLSVHQIHRSGQRTRRMMAAGIAVTTLSVLLLSAAGIHALMSFTVTRRRKEIGIRSALGADPRRLLGSVFSRALGQIAVGLVAGVAAAALLDRLAGGELMGGAAIVLLPGIAAVMLAVGLLAALGPARRGLRIQPSEALKAE